MDDDMTNLDWEQDEVGHWGGCSSESDYPCDCPYRDLPPEVTTPKTMQEADELLEELL